MRTLSLSLITVFIIGCGGGSSSSTPDASNLSDTSTQSVADAKKNAQAIASFSSLDFSRFSESTQTDSKRTIAQKTTLTLDCEGGGTAGYEVTDDEQSVFITYNACVHGGETLNGSMNMSTQDDENYEIVFDNFSHKGAYGEGYYDLTLTSSYSADVYTTKLDGDIRQTLVNGEAQEMTAQNFIVSYSDTASESWTTMDGTLGVISKCLTGTYSFKTIEKLVDAQDGTDNTESGILEINGATYTFENPYVTIKAGDEEETMTQRQFEEELEAAATTCS